MRIIQLSAHFYPVIGGKETAILNISKELIKLGHEVHVFTSDFDRIGKRITEKNGIHQGVPFRRFRSWFKAGPTAAFYPGIILTLFSTPYDLIIAHTYRQPQTDLSLMVGKLCRKKVILMTPGNFMPRKGFNKLMVTFYDRVISFIFLRFYDLIFYVGNIPEEHKNFFLKRGVKPERLLTFQSGVEPEFEWPTGINIREKFNLAEKFILSVGTISKSKGHDLLIEAIPLIKNEIEVVFAGPDGGELTEMKDLAKKLNIKNIKFLGAVSKDELINLYHECSVFVLASRYEPFGLVALEALLAGVPVVATKFGGTKEFIKSPYGKAVDPFNKMELAEAINVYIDNPYTGSESVSMAHKYSWEEQVGLLNNKLKLLFNKL
jgi:glycosyltransferase involved in cell wall biosynthesis